MWTHTIPKSSLAESAEIKVIIRVSKKMTERYAHISYQFQREEGNRLNGLIPFPLVNSKKLVRNDQKESLLISEEAYNA